LKRSSRDQGVRGQGHDSVQFFSRLNLVEPFATLFWNIFSMQSQHSDKKKDSNKSMSNPHLSLVAGVDATGNGYVNTSSNSNDGRLDNMSNHNNNGTHSHHPEAASTSSDEEDTEEQILVTTRLLAPQQELGTASTTIDTKGNGGIGNSCGTSVHVAASYTDGETSESSCGAATMALSPDETHPLTLNTEQEQPASPKPPNSLSRRRCSSTSGSTSNVTRLGNASAVLVPSVATASSSSTTTSSSSLRQRGITNNSASNGSNSLINTGNNSNRSVEQQTMGEGGYHNSNSNNNAGGLRASLDAGMAAVRRWIRHRPVTEATLTTSTGSGRTVSSNNVWVTSSPASTRFRRTPTVITTEDANSSTPSEEDDLILFDTTSNSSSTGGPIAADDFDSFQRLLQQHSQQQQQQQHQPHAQQHQQPRIPNRLAPPTILEDSIDEMESYRSLRQRALSEPDALRIRDFLFQRALNAPQRGGFRRRRHLPPSASSSMRHQHASRRTRQRTGSDSIELTTTTTTTAGARTSSSSSGASSSQLSSSAAEVLYASARSLLQQQQPQQMGGVDQAIDIPADLDTIEISTLEPSTHEEPGVATGRPNGNGRDNASINDPDPHRAARARWIRINRRFQLVITIVALVFSLLLFAILVCWVVLTSAYVVSIDKSCDVPLKAYFWLVTLQLILDVFRTDIMRLFFRWDANSNQHIPCRVITYNIAYLTYALLVLRLGIHSVYLDNDVTCRRTAPELFQSSTAFVSLTIAAWSTIILGYLVPFCFVATLLTWNGYTPSADTPLNGTPSPFTVFPSSNGAPPGCVDQLRVVVLEDFPDDFPMECCICMEDFVGTDVIVMTECSHVFHKTCCREWLRQARTCPVCRMDIPAALESGDDPDRGSSTPSRQQRHQQQSQRGPSPQLGFGPTGRPFARNDFHHDVVSLLRILRHREGQLRSRRADPSDAASPEVTAGGVTRDSTSSLARNQSLSAVTGRDDGIGHSSLEEGRGSRPYPSA
jgi:hypothetical protein